MYSTQGQGMKGVIISLWGKGSSGKALRNDFPFGKDDGGVCYVTVGWEGCRGRSPMDQGPKAWNNLLPPGSWGQLGWAGCTHQGRVSS